MRDPKGPTYLRNRRLQAKMLAFLLPAEEDELLERVKSAKTGRAGRTLVKEGPLRVTCAALARGTTLPSHHVVGPVTIQVLRGYLRVTTDAGELDVPRGGLIVLEGGLSHQHAAIEDSVVLITLSMPSPAPGS